MAVRSHKLSAKPDAARPIAQAVKLALLVIERIDCDKRDTMRACARRLL